MALMVQRVSWSLVFAILAVSIVASSFGQAALITVCSAGCNATTVQGGINASSSGDEVRIIDSREYNESVVVNVTVSLTSNSSTKPVITAAFSLPTVNITSDNVTVRNLTIKYNGTSSGLQAVNAFGRANLVIANNTILSLGTLSDYGVFFNGTNSSIIANNTISTAIGNLNYGIYVQSSTADNISSNTISANGTTNGNRGVYLDTTTSSRVTSNTIVTNGTAANYGIYVFTGSANTIVLNNITSRGTATGNHGIFL
ncbi:MAG: right-handed parallel beta-helix repeat-containing protein, partial [Candidatus Aenigmarchaeota archaeon]|nr:right-handed parallel beta-helix repeat-containing protein [Candidatus Aenigmarchaeota archaeon]